MAYVKLVRKMTRAEEVTECHTSRFRSPGMQRGKRRKQTPEQMEKANQRNRERKCWRILMEHFRPGDLYVTLTWAPDRRPEDMKEAQKDFGRYIQKLRKEYRKHGKELKALWNLEVGSRNAWHVHMVLNRIDGVTLDAVEGFWKGGKIKNMQRLRGGDGQRKLAAYLTKTEKSDPDHIRESKWSHTRNLPVPEPERHEYIRRHTWKDEEPKPPKGFYLDKDSLYSGEDPVTGYPYRHYVFLRLDERENTC